MKMVVTNIEFYQDFLTKPLGLSLNFFDSSKTLHLKKNEKPLQLIVYGAPGSSKSFTIDEETKNEDVIRTTFHPDTDYSSFVGAYKPTTALLPICNERGEPIQIGKTTLHKEQIVYKFVEQSFLKAYIGAWRKYADANEEEEPKKQFLVIEEINRGNCAQIFGDLFQLLDRNEAGFSEYPVVPDTDLSRQIKTELKDIDVANSEKINGMFKDSEDNIVEKVKNGELLLLPNNFYIWATMNTSDQSLFPIDSAFKRRWDWKYMPISNAKKNWVIEVGYENYDWWDFLEKINQKIGSTTNSEDKKLGYFFCKAKDGVISTEMFVGKVIFYLWNDVFKDYEFNDAIFNDEDGSKLYFDKFYTKEGRKSKIINEKVALFLNNLGLEPIFINEDDDFIDGDVADDTTNDDTGSDNYSIRRRDNSKYSLNGSGEYNKGEVVFEAVKKFVKDNPLLTSQEIVDDWMKLDVPNLIETSVTHAYRKQKTKDSQFDNRMTALELPNGETIYVSNQFNVPRINDFISKVNAQNWNIKIEKV